MKSKILLSKPSKEENLYSLSVSKAKTFKDCKAKFRFGYIEKMPRKDWDFHIFGKFLHEALENFYKAKIAGNDDPDNILMSKSYKMTFDNWKDKISQDQIDECRAILMQYLVKRKENRDMEIEPTVTHVEKEFNINIDNKVLLVGFIDRIQVDPDGVLHVTDYKTTKNKKYLKNDFMQLKTYAYVMCLEDPSIKKVRTSYILLRHNFDVFVKEFTREEVMEMEDVFLKYADDIGAEKLFRPSPSPLCKYCDYIEACHAGQDMLGLTIPKYGASEW